MGKPTIKGHGARFNLNEAAKDCLERFKIVAADMAKETAAINAAKNKTPEGKAAAADPQSN